MKIPYATLSKILMDQIYNTYIQIRAAQDSDSDGGKKVTRKEVWDLVSNFILVTGMKMEELISLNNGMKYNVRFRWQVIQVIVKSLNDLPEAFEEAKADDQRIDKQEAIEIVGQILKKSIPQILNLAEDQL
jgi:hypothetical protein|tara:strand:- start:305 stop:697 length:393 start_codon:yes stop_codon:yes gene_type:complete